LAAKMQYQTHILSNGLKIIHKPDNMQVVFCGVAIDVGSRDETTEEAGMAHFIEHMLFKGTHKRRSSHIINRLENVGGELNAYTTKEETIVYAAVLQEHTERSIELIADITLNSVFPQKEIEKELVVITDEIQSYNDSPSESVFDDFEDLLFQHHSIGHNILGTVESLKTFDNKNINAFHQRYYFPGNMTFFSVGNLKFDKLVRLVEKYFITNNNRTLKPERIAPDLTGNARTDIKKNTFQTHFLMGRSAYNLYHPDRIGMFLLNNILGGAGMNSKLNLSLREKHGLVYNAESVYQPLTDTGIWAVYFGSDPENAQRCEKLIRAELQLLKEKEIPEAALKKYKLQMLGQIAINNENKENMALGMGKSFMRYGNVDSMETVRAKIEQITAKQLQRIANEVFDTEKYTIIRYV
jgi:predicted Zn-dependent peptidase